MAEDLTTTATMAFNIAFRVLTCNVRHLTSNVRHLTMDNHYTPDQC